MVSARVAESAEDRSVIALVAARKGGTSGAQVASDVPEGAVVIGVVVEPLLAWLWIGGLTMGLGGLLAFVPMRRRTTNEPVTPRNEEVMA